MKRKSFVLTMLLLLIGVLTFCLAGCADVDDKPDHGGTTAEIFSLRELNVYLGKGVLLPGEDADSIILSLSASYVNENFYEEPKSYCGVIECVKIIVDEYDLHIVTKLTENYCNWEEIQPQIYSAEEGWVEYKICDKKMMKKIEDGKCVKYHFIDNFYMYEVSADFDNDKTDAENILEIENFIAAFERYKYY